MIEQKPEEDYQKKVALIDALAQLDAKQKQLETSRGYGKAYFWSITLPPMGVFYFFKYLFFMGGDKEHVKAGIISLLLTIGSLLVSAILMAVLFKQGTSSLSSPDLQILKDLATPESQKNLLQLYK